MIGIIRMAKLNRLTDTTINNVPVASPVSCRYVLASYFSVLQIFAYPNRMIFTRLRFMIDNCLERLNVHEISPRNYHGSK